MIFNGHILSHFLQAVHKSDTLNLDDLFKTMSIHVMKNDPDFDFGLRRSQNVKKD